MFLYKYNEARVTYAHSPEKEVSETGDSEKPPSRIDVTLSRLPPLSS